MGEVTKRSWKIFLFLIIAAATGVFIAYFGDACYIAGMILTYYIGFQYGKYRGKINSLKEVKENG